MRGVSVLECGCGTSFYGAAQNELGYAAAMKFATAVWLALALLPSCRPSRPPLGGSLEFRDSDWRTGQLGGHVIYRPRTSERTVSFHLYWGSSKSKRLTQTPIVAWS